MMAVMAVMVEANESYPKECSSPDSNEVETIIEETVKAGPVSKKVYSINLLSNEIKRVDKSSLISIIKASCLGDHCQGLPKLADPDQEAQRIV